MNVYEEIDKFVEDVFTNVGDNEFISCVYNCGKVFSTKKAYLSHLVNEHLNEVRKKGLSMKKSKEDEAFREAFEDDMLQEYYANVEADYLEDYFISNVERGKNKEYRLVDLAGHEFENDNYDALVEEVLNHFEENPDEYNELMHELTRPYESYKGKIRKRKGSLKKSDEENWNIFYDYIYDWAVPIMDGWREVGSNITDLRGHVISGKSEHDAMKKLFQHWREHPEEFEEFKREIAEYQGKPELVNQPLNPEEVLDLRDPKPYDPWVWTGNDYVFGGHTKAFRGRESVKEFIKKAARVINFDTMEDNGKIITHKVEQGEGEPSVKVSYSDRGNEIQFYIDEILTHPVVTKSGEKYYRCPICAKKGKSKYYTKMSDAVHHFYVEHVEDDDVNKEAEALNNILYVVGVKKAKYPWKQCIHDQMYGKHHYSKEVAQKICGAIKYRYGKALKQAFPDKILFNVEKEEDDDYTCVYDGQQFGSLEDLVYHYINEHGDTNKTDFADMPNPGIDVKPNDKNIARRIVD